MCQLGFLGNQQEPRIVCVYLNISTGGLLPSETYTLIKVSLKIENAFHIYSLHSWIKFTHYAAIVK